LELHSHRWFELSLEHVFQQRVASHIWKTLLIVNFFSFERIGLHCSLLAYHLKWSLDWRNSSSPKLYSSFCSSLCMVNVFRSFSVQLKPCWISFDCDLVTAEFFFIMVFWHLDGSLLLLRFQYLIYRICHCSKSFCLEASTAYHLVASEIAHGIFQE